MKSAGYAGRSLIAKLGYRAGEKVYLHAAPLELVKELRTAGVVRTDKLPATWFHGFFSWQTALQSFLDKTDFATIEKGLWFSWPKQAAHVPTDLTEQTFRDLILPMGWVDTKVAAIDQTWSGLKFLRRKII